MYAYLGFLKKACGNAPLWWWIMSVIVGLCSLAIAIAGQSPAALRQYWYLWVIGGLTVTFFGVTGGAFRLIDEQRSFYETRIATLKEERDKTNEASAREARAIRDERDIPQVIKELKAEFGTWMRENHIHDLSTRNRLDVNWYVERLKPHREERLIRKAFQQWKSDDFPWI